MQCYEFEAVRILMRRKLAEFGVEHCSDDLEIADLLSEVGVTSMEQLPDVVSLARNLQAGIPIAA